MATVREMAQRLAAQGVTQERFVEIMSSFGVDPTAPGSQDIEVPDGSAPLLEGEGPQRSLPMTFEQPAVFGFQPQAAAPQATPLQQRPLPYATDVQRPFELEPGQAYIQNQATERLPSALAEAIRQRPDQALIRVRKAYPILGDKGASRLPTLRAAGEAFDYALRPDEAPELQTELDLERGLDTYQRAGLSDAPDRLVGRAAAMATRLGVFGKESSEWINNKALEGISAVAPEKWASDENIYLPAMNAAGYITLTPEYRREKELLFEQQDAESAEATNAVLKDAVERIEGAPFLERAGENAFEFVEATFDMLNYMTGGDIPKEFWRIASGGEISSVIDGINEVLVGEAEERLPQMGNDMVGFMKALVKSPEDVASAYPIATAFLLYPLARRGWVKMSPGAMKLSGKIYNAAQQVPELSFPKGSMLDKAATGLGVPRVSVGGLLDQVVKLSNAFQRWKVDPAKMADPAMNQLAKELLRDAPKAEAAVRAAGTQVSEALGPRLKQRSARPVYEELSPDAPPPIPEIPESARFTFRDAPEPKPARVPVEPVEPVKLGPAVEGAETFSLKPPQKQAPVAVGVELSRIMQSSPEMAELAAALIRRGVTAEEVVSMVSRARQPSATRPVGMEVQRRGEGPRVATDPPEVLPEVAATRAAMQARRQPPTTEPVRPGFEMAVRQPEPPPVGPGMEVVPPRPAPLPFVPPDEPIRVGRRPYESPTVEPGLEPPRASRGFEFAQRQFELGADGKLRPVVGTVDKLVTKEPAVKPVNARAFEVIEDMAEAIGDRVPDIRRLMYEEFQVARADNIANLLQDSALRKNAANKISKFLEKETRQPVDKKSLLNRLERAADDPSTIYDLDIGYNHWQSGAPKRLSVVDFMERQLKVNKELRQNVQKTMTTANFSRLGTRTRKLAHQDTSGRTLAAFHPNKAIRTSMDGKAAGKTLPTPGEEVGFLVGELVDNGRLPPIIRNPPELLLEAAPEMPPMLRRRLESMKEVPAEVLRDVLGFNVGKGMAGGRDVRIPLNDLAPVGPGGPKNPAQGKLWMKSDLLQSLRYVAKDAQWLNQSGQSLTGAEAFFDGLARVVKKGGVALNPGSHAAAWLANINAAAVKYGNPFAFVEAIKWGIEHARWGKGSKRFKAKMANALFSVDEVMRATTRGNILDSSFVLTELPAKALTIKAADSFITRVKKGLSKGLALDPVARLFDIPDNIFKGWATMKGVNKYVEEWQTLPEGKSFTLPLSRGVEKRAYKRATDKPNMSDMVIDGKQLTRAQMLQNLTRSSAFDAAQTFVNFSEPSLLQAAGRSTKWWDALLKRPYSGWSSATTMVPGRQGIVGEILSGPSRRSTTDYVPLMLKRNAEAAAHGMAMHSIIGSQAAQSDETSSLFRLAKAFSTDEVKPVIAKPTGEEGAYNVWSLGNASPMEDINDTLRWMEGARSMLSGGLEHVDPTELSYLSEQERKDMFDIKPEDVDGLEPFELARLKAAQGLANPTTKGYGWSEKTLMNSALIGGSIIGEAVIAFGSGRGYKIDGQELRSGAGEWDGIAKGVKLAQRTIIPRVLSKTMSAQAEVLTNEKRALIDKINLDESLSDKERYKLIREAQSDIDYLEFISGAQYRPPMPKTAATERAKGQLSDVVLDHLFSLPRLEMFLGEGSVTEKFLKKKLKRTVVQMVDSITQREIEAAQDRLNSATDQASIDSAMAHLTMLQEEYGEFNRQFKGEIDARIDMLVEQDRAAQETVKNYSKALKGAEKDQ